MFYLEKMPLLSPLIFVSETVFKSKVFSNFPRAYSDELKKRVNQIHCIKYIDNKNSWKLMKSKWKELSFKIRGEEWISSRD